MIDFTCANCGAKGAVSDGAAGCATWCPQCGTVGRVEDAAAPPPREGRLERLRDTLRNALIYVWVGFLILLILPGLPLAAAVAVAWRLLRRRRDTPGKPADDLLRFVSLSVICSVIMVVMALLI